MTVLAIVLICLAILLFILAAVGLEAGRVSLLTLGLAFMAASFAVGYF